MASQPVTPLVRPALAEQLEAFHPSSFGWAMVCCEWDRDRAEEVLQIAYLKAIDGRARFNGHSSSRTWFFGVVKKTAEETRRSGLARVLRIRRWSRTRPVDSPVPTPEQVSGDAEIQRRLQRTLARLSSRQREMLHLVFYQEMTIEQAADVLNLRIGTARTHYQRGKARLRALLEGAGDTR